MNPSEAELERLYAINHALTERMHILQKQRDRALSTINNILGDKWARTQSFKNFDCTVGESCKQAVKDIQDLAAQLEVIGIP